MIYDINGNTLLTVYDVNGTSLAQAYDINGNNIFPPSTGDIIYDSAHSNKHLYAGGYIEILR